MTVKKKCVKCKNDLENDSKFCITCGHKVGDPVFDEVTENGQFICPKCKRNLPPGNSFCVNCNQSVDVSNAKINNTELRCNKCNMILKPDDKFCTECGQKTNFIVRPTSTVAPSNNEANSLPSASEGKPLLAANIFGYNLTEEQMVTQIIKKEIGENFNHSIASVENKKLMFTVIYSIILFICLSLFFFHSCTGFLCVIFLIITIIYIVMIRKYGLVKFLQKEVESRPDEKIGYIVSSVLTGTVNSTIYKMLKFILLTVAIIIPLFVFRSPHTIYEYDDTLDGYVIRFYTIGWLKNDSELVIPDNYKGKSVVGIRGDVFANVYTIKKVILPDSIKEIRGQAFQYAHNLEEINIPDGITEIKGNTFEGCNLKEVTIPDSVTRIGGHAFRENSNLRVVNISPNSKLEEIGSSAFRDCYRLTEIYLPEDVLVNGRAFKGSGTRVKTYYSGGYKYHEDVSIGNVGDSAEIEISEPDAEFKGGSLKLLNSYKEDYEYTYSYELMFEYNGKTQRFVVSSENPTYQIDNSAIVSVFAEYNIFNSTFSENDYTTGYNDFGICCYTGDNLKFYVNYN